MNDHNDIPATDHDAGPPPRDELDALLRIWHRQSADRAMAARNRLLRKIAKTPQPLPRPRLLSLPTPRRWLSGALAAAACILIALLLIWSHPGNGRAFAQDLREIGFAPPLPIIDIWLDPNDDAAFRDAEQAVAQAHADLQQALAGQRPDLDPWRPWTELYRNLMSLGRWDEALAEAHSFLAYAKQRDEQPDRYTMYYTGLAELGNIYQAVGDYETALAYHQESLRVASDYHEWRHRTGPSTDPRPHALDTALAATLPPRLWALSKLAATQGDQETAWDLHDQAGERLVRFLRAECAYRKLTEAIGAPASPPIRAPSASEGGVPADASLYEMCITVITAADRSSTTDPSPCTTTTAILVRQHLLHQAMLSRLDREPDAAAESLELTRTVPYYPHRDDFRQDFNIPMEELRTAVARGDFSAAVAAADEAEQHTGPRHFEGYPDHPPIGILARAELKFLKGVALAGLDKTDPNALRAIESAIEAVQQSAAALPEAQRKRLLARFNHWEHIAEQLQ